MDLAGATGGEMDHLLGVAPASVPASAAGSYGSVVFSVRSTERAECRGRCRDYALPAWF